MPNLVLLPFSYSATLLPTSPYGKFHVPFISEDQLKWQVLEKQAIYDHELKYNRDIQ